MAAASFCSQLGNEVLSFGGCAGNSIELPGCCLGVVHEQSPVRGVACARRRVLTPFAQELRRAKEELAAQLEEVKQHAGYLAAQLDEAHHLQAEMEGKVSGCASRRGRYQPALPGFVKGMCMLSICACAACFILASCSQHPRRVPAFHRPSVPRRAALSSVPSSSPSSSSWV